MDTLPFYIFLFIHLVSLIVGFGSVIVIDFFGLTWLLGKNRLSQVNKVAGVTQKLVWLGWFGLVLSGIGLITMKGYIDPLTQLKLFFVAMVGVNGVFLHFIKKSMGSVGDISPKDMPNLLKFRITLSTLVSQLGWWGAISIGFIHRHWRHNIPWPDRPELFMFAIAGIFALAFLAGELALRPSKAKESFSSSQVQ